MTNNVVKPEISEIMTLCTPKTVKETIHVAMNKRWPSSLTSCVVFLGHKYLNAVMLPYLTWDLVEIGAAWRSVEVSAQL